VQKKLGKVSLAKMESLEMQLIRSWSVQIAKKRAQPDEKKAKEKDEEEEST
jgi:hypothetical protein